MNISERARETVERARAALMHIDVFYVESEADAARIKAIIEALNLVERSAREERERIVEWLRSPAFAVTSMRSGNIIADAIERGDHRDRRA